MSKIFSNLLLVWFWWIIKSVWSNCIDINLLIHSICGNLQSHPTLSFEERSRLCGCLNYAKMSLESCKDLAKNPRIPPNIAVQALKLQHSKIPESDFSVSVKDIESPSMSSSSGHMVLYNDNVERLSQENQEMKMNIQRMQWRVMELENACKEMKGRISKVVRHDVNVTSSSAPYNYSSSSFTRLCWAQALLFSHKIYIALHVFLVKVRPGIHVYHPRISNKDFQSQSDSMFR